ncbi:MAG TPA: hypothetical protein VFD95_03095 [Usitatibacter sp.]|jgi:hypothetical protein|nr:hypothetical protein [Usitatibacter sp.]
MRRHTPGTDPASVPVLTDMVQSGPSVPARGPHADLAREIFARVMGEVEGRLAADLERRLNQQLVPQVHAVVASAIADLHNELAGVIGDAINRALEHRNLK